MIKLLMHVHPLLQNVPWGKDNYNTHPGFQVVKDRLVGKVLSTNFIVAFGDEYKSTKNDLDRTVRNMQALAKKSTSTEPAKKRVKRAGKSFPEFYKYIVQLN